MIIVQCHKKIRPLLELTISPPSNFQFGQFLILQKEKLKTFKLDFVMRKCGFSIDYFPGGNHEKWGGWVSYSQRKSAFEYKINISIPYASIEKIAWFTSRWNICRAVYLYLTLLYSIFFSMLHVEVNHFTWAF